MHNEELEQLEELKKMVAALVTSKKKFIKLSDKRSSMRPGDYTPKQIEKAEADLNWHAMAYDQLFRNVHACAVDCGLSRPNDHYGHVEYNPSPFHKYLHKPRVPKCRQ